MRAVDAARHCTAHGSAHMSRPDKTTAPKQHLEASKELHSKNVKKKNATRFLFKALHTPALVNPLSVP